MRRDHPDSLPAKLLVQLVAVIRPLADQVPRLRFDHIEVKRQLHQGGFMVMGRVGAGRHRMQFVWLLFIPGSVYLTRSR
ncbi:MAG: hypothetical protein V3V56_08375 [bacterium]